MRWGDLVEYVKKAEKEKLYSEEDMVIITMYTHRKRTRARVFTWGFAHDGRQKAFSLGVSVDKHPKMQNCNMAGWKER